MTNATTYIAYINQGDGRAFFNAAPSTYGRADPEIGDEVNGAVVESFGSLVDVEATIARINAALPVTSFGDLLAE